MARREQAAGTGEGTRRDEIIRVAASVFASKGIMNATVRDIGERVGILSGSLYHHFASKDEIIAEVMRPIIDEYINVSTEVIERHDSPLETIRNLVMAGVDLAARHPDATRVLRNDGYHLREIPRLEALAIRRLDVRALWITVLERGIAEGVFRADLDCYVVASAMFDVVQSSIRWFAPLGHLDPDHVGRQIADWFVGGLVAPGVPAAQTAPGSALPTDG